VRTPTAKDCIRTAGPSSRRRVDEDDVLRLFEHDTDGLRIAFDQSGTPLTQQEVATILVGLLRDDDQPPRQRAIRLEWDRGMVSCTGRGSSTR
jgi:hypothetical protein